ncbi:hypothetical protein TNIN_84191 [Trichonephila inaurata madagascariensis]|uniref:Uncharacterized protein n=1 Tax=Trichonephila inaurata madagascariensis TaxID=2747483 RepID=A0A8X7BRF8_9ARAC|nr:hypothetical protein TNIN_84191 [Trichonephila inaurata madagascariensis]
MAESVRADTTNPSAQQAAWPQRAVRRVPMARGCGLDLFLKQEGAPPHLGEAGFEKTQGCFGDTSLRTTLSFV